MKMKKRFDVYDYLVFISILLISLFIGVYHGFKNLVIKKCTKTSDKQDETELHQSNKGVSEYLQASSSMNPIPVAFSLLASFFFSYCFVRFFRLKYMSMVFNIIS